MNEIEQTALVIRDNRTITPDIIEQAKTLAQRTSRFLGMTETVAEATFLKGWELGFKMTAAPEFIQVIQGRPTLSPRGHLALLHHSGIFRGNGYLKVKDIYDDNGGYVGCQAAMKRNDSNVEFETTFTMEDARRAGLIKKDSGWEKYPANMCRWRTIGYGADVIGPDIGGGMKRADEFGADITPDGDVIPGSWSTIQPANGFNAAMAELLQDFGPDTVTEIAEGKLPGTIEEIQALRAKLENGDAE